MKNKAECVCPTCPNTLKPVCASDRVQDLSECHLRRQACQGNITVTVTKQGPCGMSVNNLMVIETLVFTRSVLLLNVTKNANNKVPLFCISFNR